jgi:radical SAM superfamily enzyme YgiQ (UPF0313 family)
MKVLLIYPDTDPLSVIPSGLINIEPLGLEYLAGDLSGHDVSILDMKIEKHWQRIIERQSPDVVGITGTVVHASRILTVLEYVKSINPRAVTVVGGPHATLVPDDFVHPAIDVLIAGHQPILFRRVVESIARGANLSFVPGLKLKTRGSWVSTLPARKVENLDHLPLPRRDLTAKYRRQYRHLVWQPVALMITSVGCPHACSFCPCPALTDHRVLRRSPEMVLREMLQINEPYIYIGDDNLFFDYRHAMRIASLVQRAGLKKQFYCLSRADDIIKHPDLVERWAEIGLKKVFLGLESPNDDEIKALNKRGTVSGNSQAVEILHANGIDPLGAFIIGPDYTREDFDRVLDYMDRMRIYYFEFTILTPFPGTKFYDEVKDQIVSRDTRVFDLAHSLFPTRLPIDEFYREYSRLHRRAASPLRALRLNPVVSPFQKLSYFRQTPRLANLFLSSRRAYRKLRSDGVTSNVPYQGA